MHLAAPNGFTACSDICATALRWLTWPLALALAAVAAAWLSHDPAMALPLQAVTLLASIALVLLAERVLPFRRAWQHGAAAQRRADGVSFVMVLAVVDPFVKRGLLPLIGAAAAPWLTRGGGLALFPTHWPLALQLLLALLIADAATYVLHRAAHRVRWLWALHGFHHNPTRLYWLNGLRVHPLNLVLNQLAGLGLLVAIGTPAVVLQMLVLITTVIAVFQHANADLRYDGWNRIFGTADLHRWHHATGPGARQVNFGTALSIWDQLFGTYQRGGAPAQVGVDTGPPRASGYFSGLWEAMRNAYRPLG